MLARSPWPTVSVVIPCRNEARHIAACLDSILATRYPADRLDVLVVDGASDDGTRLILQRYAATHRRIRMLDNPQRTTAPALNIGIRAAAGEVIMRMDGHVIYPPDYIHRLVAALQESGADNVGGVIVTLPADNSAVARAIAIALSHPFGVGNAYFRIGAGAPRIVDSVAFGCWRRALFDRIGLFDEEFVRNQDDELNQRIAKHGGWVLLVPDIYALYYARRSLGQVARMYYHYGYYKPLVAKKTGRLMTVRQLVPALFLLGLVGGTILHPWWPLLGRLAIVELTLYAATVLACAAATIPRHGRRAALALAAVFPAIHVGYGLGFLRGLVDHLLRWRRRAAPAVLPVSR